MTTSYTPQTWVNDEAGNTAINATRLNHIETGVKNAADDVATVAGTVPVVGAAGSGAAKALSANDPTTTNPRTPTAHTHTKSQITDLGTIPVVAAAGSGAANALSANDPTTTNARTPSTHGSTHATGGSDPISIGAGQVTSGTFDVARIPSGLPYAASSDIANMATTDYVTTAVSNAQPRKLNVGDSIPGSVPSGTLIVRTVPVP